jgi:hypothetical protein
MSEYDSSDQSEGEVSATPATPATSCPPISQNGDIEYVGSRKGPRQYLVVDHTAYQRSGSKISTIWHHGNERRRLDDGSMDRYWRCALCKGATILKMREGGGGQTSYALRHLKKRHNIEIDEDLPRQSLIPQPQAVSQVAQLRVL